MADLSPGFIPGLEEDLKDRNSFRRFVKLSFTDQPPDDRLRAVPGSPAAGRAARHHLRCGGEAHRGSGPEPRLLAILKDEAHPRWMTRREWMLFTFHHLALSRANLLRTSLDVFVDIACNRAFPHAKHRSHAREVVLAVAAAYPDAVPDDIRTAVLAVLQPVRFSEDKTSPVLQCDEDRDQDDGGEDRQGDLDPRPWRGAAGLPGDAIDDVAAACRLPTRDTVSAGETHHELGHADRLDRSQPAAARVLSEPLSVSSLEAFVKLFSFPMVAVSMRDLVAPKRRCATCGSRFLTTLDEARMHGRAPNGLALEVTPTLHRCIRCHELTVFVSVANERGIAVPYEQREQWAEHLFPELRRC